MKGLSIYQKNKETTEIYRTSVLSNGMLHVQMSKPLHKPAAKTFQLSFLLNLV